MDGLDFDPKSGEVQWQPGLSDLAGAKPGEPSATVETGVCGNKGCYPGERERGASETGEAGDAEAAEQQLEPLPASTGRDAQGRFLPGRSGNPRGRPVTLAEVIEAARGSAPAAIERLHALTGSDNEGVALRASTALLDRAFGRPGQVVRVEAEGDMSQLSDAELIAIAAEVISDVTDHDQAAEIDAET